MNRLSLKHNRLKFKIAGILPIILEEFHKIYPNLIKENRRMSTCTRLDLQTLGSQLVMSKSLPNHWFEQRTFYIGAFCVEFILACQEWVVRIRLVTTFKEPTSLFSTMLEDKVEPCRYIEEYAHCLGLGVRMINLCN